MYKKIYETLTFTICALVLFSNANLKAEGFYAGLGYLKSEHNIIKYSSLTYTAYDDKDDGFSFFAGYDFNNRFAVEAGYNDLGKSTRSVSTGLNAENEIKVTTIAGVLKTNPIANNLVFFIKGGLARINHDEDITGASTGNFSANTNNFFYGIGANYELSNGLAVRAAYEVYGEDDGLTSATSTESKPDQADPKALSISLIKRF